MDSKKPDDANPFADVTAGQSSTAPSADTQADGTADRTYTVVSGDSLSKIAKHAYGDGSRWREIFEANRDVLTDPDKIFPGQTLRLP
ncbi:MAG: LysM peptidoglycan-binding domain-containing protein [Gemmatimonadota bacterium]